MLTKTDLIIKEAVKDTGIVLEDEHYDIAYEIINKCANIISPAQAQVIFDYFQIETL